MSCAALEGPIRDKRQMYQLLAGGAFGNTIPQYFSLEEWQASADSARWTMWGVRTMTPGGPCRLYTPRDEVAETAESFQKLGATINISCMIDAILTVNLFADIYDSPTGLRVYGVERPGPGASWRKAMPERGRDYSGLAARLLLEKYMNANSRADLEAVFDAYPGHIVELSACDRCFGTVPGRDCVIWECRAASGEYERSTWGNY